MADLDSLIVEGLGKRYVIPAKRPATSPTRTLNLGVTRVRLPRLRLPGGATEGRDLWALRNVSFSVPRSTILGILGANGAGKSTLLMTICGSPRARTGRVLFEGQDITQLPTYEIMRRGIAHAPEGRRIFPRMTVLENLMMGALTAEPGHFEEDLETAFTLFPIL